jgi:hypothetical protein
VADLREQRVLETEGDGAVKLALDDHRIDQAAVVADPVAENPHATRLRIYLRKHHVGPAGIRDFGRLEVVRRLQPGRHAARGRRNGGRGRQPTQRDRTRGVTPKGEGLAVLLYLVLRHPQRLRGEPHALRAQRARRQRHRVAADDGPRG